MPSLRTLCDRYKVKPDPSGIKRTITEELRSSFAFIYEPRAMNEGDVPKYSIQLIADKKNEKTVKPLVQIAANAAAAKWGPDPSKWPKMKYNIMTEDTELDEGNLDSIDKHLVGMITLNARNTSKPGVVGPSGKPIMNEDEFYSGCICRASISCYAYDKSGNKGISFSLQNLMKVRDAERLDGRSSAEDDFSSYAFEENYDEDQNAESGSDEGF